MCVVDIGRPLSKRWSLCKEPCLRLAFREVRGDGACSGFGDGWGCLGLGKFAFVYFGFERVKP